MNAEGDGALHSFQADSCYVTLPGKKLVVRVRDIIAGENKAE